MLLADDAVRPPAQLSVYKGVYQRLVLVSLP